jgi:hypothetical protein
VETQAKVLGAGTPSDGMKRPPGSSLFTPTASAMQKKRSKSMGGGVLVQGSSSSSSSAAAMANLAEHDEDWLDRFFEAEAGKRENLVPTQAPVPATPSPVKPSGGGGYGTGGSMAMMTATAATPYATPPEHSFYIPTGARAGPVSRTASAMVAGSSQTSPTRSPSPERGESTAALLARIAALEAEREAGRLAQRDLAESRSQISFLEDELAKALTELDDTRGRADRQGDTEAQLQAELNAAIAAAASDKEAALNLLDDKDRLEEELGAVKEEVEALRFANEVLIQQNAQARRALADKEEAHRGEIGEWKALLDETAEGLQAQTVLALQGSLDKIGALKTKNAQLQERIKELEEKLSSSQRDNNNEVDVEDVVVDEEDDEDKEQEQLMREED